MAYSIFICDDNINHLNKIKLIIEHYILFHEEQFRIEKATTSLSSFLEYIDNNEINEAIYFLDVDFKQDMNGIDLALRIKQLDVCARIIFISSYNNYATLTLKNKIEPVDYINKLQDIDDLQNEIISCLKYCYNSIVAQKQQSKSIFKFSINSSIYFININEIIFIENSKIPHVLTLVTKSSRYNFYDKISRIDKEYEALFKISRSCIVNPLNITQINFKKREVYLKENFIKKFSLSKSKILREYTPE
ncbi:DNA-binding response regulator [Mammaliicoccus sciuri]|uniref:DNA-binding response regulator n=1 Tax=Mammaliicoccus sciuri TaxID=1296 RepID=UPI0021D19824|nr:DNA-binding response regulator [Mammaliicoccus sciuri]UXU84300.1 DNA-binding response regulator [Mammaliicoccus sciuri]UXU94149.1 DNA-binding response regulator [Mammaliicoccus sciuri]UXV16097.1 DNA-binding response regulator [Mammaliicoccus sciuri]UXV24359.1 DNA-binding response regulator [Mammaliicoccus sciuri]UXV27142.1 DNA-binding response regulator [Mammaliicoccus sciuri]